MDLTNVGDRAVRSVKVAHGTKAPGSGASSD